MRKIFAVSLLISTLFFSSSYWAEGFEGSTAQIGFGSQATLLRATPTPEEKLADPDCKLNSGIYKLCVLVTEDEENISFYLINRERFHFTIDFEFNELNNMERVDELPGSQVAPGRGAKLLAQIRRPNTGAHSYRYSYWYTIGSKDADGSNYTYRLPFRSDFDAYVSQGNNGTFSHQNTNAIDFTVDEGTPLYAARKGIVGAIEESATESCDTRGACSANYVSLVHQDGTVSEYLHLQTNGVLVELGDVVEAGQFIGYSGNTGFSTGPHLHFHVKLPKSGREQFRVSTSFYAEEGAVTELLEGSTYKTVDTYDGLVLSEAATDYPCSGISPEPRDCSKGPRASSAADFNGDGKTDLLIRSADGGWWMYLLDGSSIASQGRVGATANLDWAPVAFADFNGDGKADILIRNNNLGIWWLYSMDGSTIINSSRVQATRDLAFVPLSFKDTDGDGKADILLRHSDGRWWRYGMSGATIIDNESLSLTRDNDFEPKSFDDFNGDGKADVLLRHKTNGLWYLYELDGANVSGSGALGANRDLGWIPVSTDDVNGDGRADLMVRNVMTRKWWLYLLNGNSISTSGSLRASSDASWKPVVTADFNGDGAADQLLRSAAGAWWSYQMNGLNIVSQGRVELTGSTDWRPVSTSDFDGDGKADVLVRNAVTGGWWLYSLDGSSVLKSSNVSATSNLDWRLQPQ